MKDEIFHYDQLKSYQENDFLYWNNKITTPPGTYLIMWPFIKFMEVIGINKTLILGRMFNW
jgi:alpha-1,2-glucosyltransferase